MRVTIDASPEEVAALVVQIQKQDYRELHLKFSGGNTNDLVEEDDQRVKMDRPLGREDFYIF